MKKQNSNFLQNKKTQKLFIFILFIFSFCVTHAQQAPTFDKNISLPEESGGFCFDIIQANSKLFVHAQNKVFVYNESNNELYDIIDLVDNQYMTKHFGKYAPPYFDYGFYSPSRQTMAINEDKDLIYTITPNLNIISIETIEPYQFTTLVERPSIIEHFHIASGRIVIKYDSEHERLYLLLSGRDDINSPGSFHITDSYFAIYDVNPITGNLILIYDELKCGHEGTGGNGYLSTASDIEFNHNTSSNKFYVARLKKLEIWEITGDPNNPVSLVNSINISAAKIGKLLTVQNANLHKILALPYRLPGGGVEPDLDY